MVLTVRRDVDFFSVYRDPIDAKGGLDRMAVTGLALIAVCTAVVVGVFAYAQCSSLALQNRITGVRRYLSRSDVSQAGRTVSDGSRKIRALREYGATASSNVQAFSSLTAPDSGLVGAVIAAAPAGTAVSGTQYADSVLKISCTAGAPDAAAVYTAALQQTGRFQFVTYSGVSQSGGAYAFDIRCTLKGGTGQ